MVSTVPKPQRRATGVDRRVAGLERRCARSRRGRLDVGGGRHAHLARKARAKLRSLMCGARGERGHREVGVEVVGDPGLQLAQRLALGGLRGELRAELRLAAGALQEQHEPARRLERDLAAEVLLDQRERQVHAGGDAGRGVEVAVAHEDRVGLDGHARVARRASASQPAQCVVARRPSSRPAAASRKAPVQTPAVRRERPPALRSGQEGLVVLQRADAGAARHDERVDRPAQRGQRGVGHRDAPLRRRAARARRDDRDLVGPAGEPGGGEKTSAGPTTSSGWTSGKATMTTRRGLMAPMIRLRPLAARTNTGRFSRHRESAAPARTRARTYGVKRNVTTSPSRIA